MSKNTNKKKGAAAAAPPTTEETEAPVAQQGAGDEEYCESVATEQPPTLGTDTPPVELTLEEKLLAQAEHWKEYAQRAQAEFENTRKRLETRHLDEVKRASMRVVEALIPVIDDIEYAMAHAAETNNEMADGLKAIHTKFIGALTREGVEVIDPTGLAFDSETAQAVGMVETAEFAENTVVQVVQKGYRLGGRLLRPAMVMVAAAAK